MKVVKVIVSIFLGFMMFVAALLFSLLTTGRILFSGGSMAKMLEKSTEEYGSINLNGIDKSDDEVDMSEILQAVDAIDGYVSRKEIYRELGNFSSDVIKYFLGAKDDISTKSIKKLLNKVETKYKEETGSTVNFAPIYQAIDDSTKEVKRNMKDIDRDDREAIELLGKIYDNGLYAGIIVAFGVCAILMFAINKNLKPVYIHLAIITTLCSICNFIMMGVMNKIGEEEDFTGKIIAETIQKDFMIIAVGFIVLAIVFVILAITKKNKQQVITA